MVERFGYSLDIGKSLKSEENANQAAQTEESSKFKKDNSEEDSKEPLEIPKEEDLSENSTQKDILDDIKEDIEINPINADGIDEDSADELPEDDNEEVVDDTIADDFEENYAEESISADKIPPIVDEDESAQDEDVIDTKEELDEFEEPMPDEPEKEPEEESERPKAPEEEDITEMIDQSFKENNNSSAFESSETISSDSDDEKNKGFNWWKWGAGIAVILILAVIVYKLGFVGVVNNTPTAAIPSDEEIDQELEEFFKETDLTDVSEESSIVESVNDNSDVTKNLVYKYEVAQVISEQTPVESEIPVDEIEEPESLIIKQVGRGEPITFKTESEPKDPDELLDILNQGLN